jgi:hypothetical protein
MRAGYTSQFNVSLAGLICGVNEMYAVLDVTHTQGYLHRHSHQGVALKKSSRTSIIARLIVGSRRGRLLSLSAGCCGCLDLTQQGPQVAALWVHHGWS